MKFIEFVDTTRKANFSTKLFLEMRRNCCCNIQSNAILIKNLYILTFHTKIINTSILRFFILNDSLICRGREIIPLTLRDEEGCTYKPLVCTPMTCKQRSHD